MARNLNDLAKRFYKLADDHEKRSSAVAVKVATELLNNLLWDTPVDTSAALSNWQVSVDSPLRGFIQPYVPGFKGYTAVASISEAFIVGTAVLATKKPGQVIYISNNTPYIRALNSGTSKQAPAGFVEMAVLKARKHLPTIKY